MLRRSAEEDLALATEAVRGDLAAVRAACARAEADTEAAFQRVVAAAAARRDTLCTLIRQHVRAQLWGVCVGCAPPAPCLCAVPPPWPRRATPRPPPCPLS